MSNQDLDEAILGGQSLPHEMAMNQNLMFGRNDEAFDDDDYAYQKQRRAKMQSRKLTALSYDTAKRPSKVAGNDITPILKEKGRPPLTQSVTRATRLALQSSAKADL